MSTVLFNIGRRVMSNGNDENEELENGDAKMQFRRGDGVEKDGYICFPVSTGAVTVDEIPEEQIIGEIPHSTETYNQQTCPDDPRYQQTNKTNWCYRMYIDYQRCRNLLGGNSIQCKYFYNCYQSICPSSWHERWDDQREKGTFPRDVNIEHLPPAPPPCP